MRTHTYIYGLPCPGGASSWKHPRALLTPTAEHPPKESQGQRRVIFSFFFRKMGKNYSEQGTAMNCHNSQIQVCFQLEKEPLHCSQTSLSFPPGGTWQQRQFDPCCLQRLRKYQSSQSLKKISGKKLLKGKV